MANERSRAWWSKMLAVSSSSSGRWRAMKAATPSRTCSTVPSTLHDSAWPTIAFSAGVQ